MASNFWNESSTTPKRKFRWVMSVDGIPHWTIKKVSRPQYQVSEAEHKFINHTFYFPGRVTYNEIDFTIVDTCDPDAAETLRQILFAGGYRLPDSAATATQSLTKHGAVRALGLVEISMLTGGGIGGSGGSTGTASGNDEGTVVENWELHNCWIKDIQFSELDYEGDDLAEVTIKLRYDFAKLNKNTSPYGVGDGGLVVGAPSALSANAAIGEDPDRQD